MVDEDDTDDGDMLRPLQFNPVNAAWVVLNFGTSIAEAFGTMFQGLGLLCGAHAKWQADRAEFAERTRAEIESLP